MTDSNTDNKDDASQTFENSKKYINESFETYESYKSFLEGMYKNMSGNPENTQKEQTESKKTSSDYEQAFHSYRENLSAMGEANRMAMEIMKSIAHIQSQYIKQVFDDFGQMIRENAEDAQQNPTESADPSQHFKKAMNRAFDHSSQIADILINSNHELFENAKKTINDNVSLFNNIMFKSKH